MGLGGARMRAQEMRDASDCTFQVRCFYSSQYINQNVIMCLPKSLEFLTIPP
jgi:hypothetical protein